ncbi:hypothetical protein K4F52_004559 [Lecanicillium sp. MT-2017a]|nr:hypothetical protein K4F52_004559 [Lecanicillium sp. MT-2017a]
MPLNILISGAGIAGPAAAFWLSRLGHTCTIIERFPTIRSNGLQIDLRRQGVAAAEKMGLLDQVYKHSVDEEGFRLVNSKGKTIGMMARNDKDDTKEQNFSSAFEIMRADLVQILSDANKDKVRYRLGLSVVTYQNVGDKVKVILSDNSEETYDLLIAADERLEVFAGYYTLPRTETDSEYATLYHSPGRRITITRFHTRERGQVYLTAKSHTELFRSALKGDVATQKAAFATAFKGMGWEEERLLKSLAEADDFYCEEMTQRRSSTWSRGRVVLLGDAGYCPTPLSGVCTSLAFIGAYVLAGELSIHDDNVDAALAGYEKNLRPAVQELQKLPLGVPDYWLQESALGVRMLHMVFTVVTTPAVAWALEKMLLWTGRINSWELPEYSKLDVIKEEFTQDVAASS